VGAGLAITGFPAVGLMLFALAAIVLGFALVRVTLVRRLRN